MKEHSIITTVIVLASIIIGGNMLINFMFEDRVKELGSRTGLNEQCVAKNLTSAFSFSEKIEFLLDGGIDDELRSPKIKKLMTAILYCSI